MSSPSASSQGRRDLRGCDACFGSDGLDLVGQAQVAVDAVGTESLQQAFDSGTDVGQAAVQVPGALTGRDETEPGRRHDLVTAARQSLAEKLLAGVRVVDLSRVDERHPQLQRLVKGADRFRLIRPGAGVAVGHTHRTQTDPRHFQFAKFDAFHSSYSF